MVSRPLCHSPRLLGVPLLVPSFLYEGVHNQHHAKLYYGTIDDPEYLPLALMKMMGSRCPLATSSS